MTDAPTSRHDEMVHHMRRHTELRRRAAEIAREEALRGGTPEEDVHGGQAGG